LVHDFDKLRHVFEYVKGAGADFLVIAAFRSEAGHVLHRQLVQFFDGSHADRIEFHLLLFGGDGVQTLVMLILNQLL
jgi:hypothetical protein